MNDDSPAQPLEHVITQNALTTNGLSPNSLAPNGIHPNGVTLSGLGTVGVGPNGTPIGIAGSGAPLAGAAIVGSTWTGFVSDGTTVTVRIDAATQGTGSNADLWFYRMSVLGDGMWRPACFDAAGNPGDVESVNGTWNYAQGVPGGGGYAASSSRFTIACRGSTIAKCVELGYKPWVGAAAELAACVRALRADFCGDGTPFTVDGTMVNIFDNRGIQPDSVSWVPEAEWTPDGASCISREERTRYFQIVHRRPACVNQTLLARDSCGTGFGAGAVLITELAP